jgi:hypothetical protein
MDSMGFNSEPLPNEIEESGSQYKGDPNKKFEHDQEL